MKKYAIAYMLILSLLLLNINIYSQAKIKGQIIEKDTKFPLPFASVVYQTDKSQNGVISDLNGIFEINDINVTAIKVSFMGYKTQEVLMSELSDVSNILIELEINSHDIAEIVVTQANNPAIRIIKKTLENKDVNNHLKYEKYSYMCYFKTLIDIKFANEAAITNNMKIKQKLNQHAGFISECVISCISINNHQENKIIAHKTSGFDDALLVQSFVSMFHNSISFYENIIPLFETSTADNTTTDFVSPLSEQCFKVYNFYLENTYYQDSDTIFIINFSPQKGTNCNSLKGQLFISSNKYALKSIVAEPFEKGLIFFKFHQNYQYVENKWFPSVLEEEIGWISKKIDKDINAYPVYLITSTIDSICFEPDIRQNQLDLEKVSIDKLAMANSDSILNIYRKDTLTRREINTFHFVDSLSAKDNFAFWLNLIPKLAENKIPIYFIDLDISNIYNQNAYEKNRLGLCIYTNEKIFKNITLGAFTAYGFKDEKLKYGGIIKFNFNKNKDIFLNFSYQDDLIEVGKDETSIFSVTSNTDYQRSYISHRFDNCLEKKVEFTARTIRYLKIVTSVSSRKFKPTYIYFYNNELLTDYQADEFKISAKLSYKEVITKLGEQRIIDFYGNPIITLTYKKGINIFDKQSFKYNRIEADIEFSLYGGLIGRSDFCIKSGYTDENLPYSLLFTGDGSKSSEYPLIINNSFQTMTPYEFVSDKYINLFYSHNFGSLLFKTKKFKPQFIILQNTGLGKLKNQYIHNLELKVKDKVYLESGLIINNIIKLKYLNMIYFGAGVGAFYRYGYYGYEDYKDNLALKISLTITIN